VEANSFVQPTSNFHKRERKGSMGTLHMRNRCGKLPIFIWQSDEDEGEDEACTHAPSAFGS